MPVVDSDKARHVDAIEEALAGVYRRGCQDDGRAIERWDEICAAIERDAPLKERMRAVSIALTQFAKDLGWRQPS